MNSAKIFEENRALLGESALDNDLQKDCLYNTDTNQNIKIVRARSGHPVLQVLGEYGAWHTLHSLVDPYAEAKRFAENVTPLKNSIVVILGMGMGYHAEQLLKNTENQPVVIIEKNREILKSFLHTVTLKEWAKDRFVYFIATDDTAVVLKRISRIQLKHALQPFTIVEHRPSTRLYPQFYSSIKHMLGHIQNINIGAKCRYQKFKNEQLRILIIHSKYYLLAEILNSLKKLGHNTKLIMVETDHEGQGSQEVIEKIIAEILVFKPDFVLTINHLGFDRAGILTQFFTDIELPYASWYVDSPVFILEDFKKQISPLLAIFVWDSDYISDLTQRGFEHVFYLPLATDPDIFKDITLHANPLKKIACDVGFVGNSGEHIIDECTQKLHKNRIALKLLDRFARQFMLSKERLLQNIQIDLSAEEHYEYQNIMENMRSVFEPAVTWRATQIYRIDCIKKLLGFRPRIHGDPGWSTHVNGHALLGSELNYYEELPHFYNVCTVNFNTTSLQMKQGVNQRVFDVPACRSFLLTDYRRQIENMFEIDKEVVCYNHPDEIKDLISFYLRHPTHRQSIAAKAYTRVLEEHTYMHRITMLLDHMRTLYG